MLSSQIGDISEKTDYSALCKTYSIWVCFDVPAKAANTVSRYSFAKEDLFGTYEHDTKSDYDLMQAVIIRLSKEDDRIGNGLVDLLHGIFGNLECREKLRRLDELGLSEPSICKEVEQMCNLSDLIEDRGKIKEKKEIALKMLNDGVPHEKVAKYVNISIDTLKRWDEEALCKV